MGKKKKNNFLFSKKMIAEYKFWGTREYDFDLALFLASHIENKEEILPTLFLMGYALASEIARIENGEKPLIDKCLK